MARPVASTADILWGYEWRVRRRAGESEVWRKGIAGCVWAIFGCVHIFYLTVSLNYGGITTYSVFYVKCNQKARRRSPHSVKQHK